MSKKHDRRTFRSSDVLPQLHQVVGDTPPPSEAGLARRKHFLGFTEVLQSALDHPLVHFPQVRREGDRPVAGDLLLAFPILWMGTTTACFHSAGIVPPSQHLWKKPSRVLRKDSGTSISIWYETMSSPVETFTFLIEASAVSAQCRVKGELTGKLSSAA